MQKHDLVIYGQNLNKRLITIDELGRLVGRHPDILRKYITYGLIDPDIEEPEPLFEDCIIARIRKIERLKRDLGLNLAGCGLVMDLLEQIAELESRLERIRRFGS